MSAPLRPMQIQYLADRPDAVPTVARWYYDEWGHKDPTNSFELTCERLAGKLNKDRLPLPIIAVDTGRTVIGTAQLKRHEMDIFPDREFWLGSIYVAPSARGCGLATTLVNKIVELAVEFQVKELWLQTEALNGGLYARLGWKIVEQLEDKGTKVAVMLRDMRV